MSGFLLSVLQIALDTISSVRKNVLYTRSESNIFGGVLQVRRRKYCELATQSRRNISANTSTSFLRRWKLPTVKKD